MKGYGDIKKELEELRKEMKDQKCSNDWQWQYYEKKYVPSPPPGSPKPPRNPHTPVPTTDDFRKDIEDLMKEVADAKGKITGKSEDDLYKIGYMDGKMNEPEDERYKDQESYQMGYRDGKGDVE